MHAGVERQPIDRMLVPLDGSAAAEAALPFAALIPSRLVYLLAVEPGEFAYRAGASGADRGETDQAAGTRHVREYLRRAAEPFHHQGREVETIVFGGDPAERILEAAADVDLIVMATHGRGAVGRALFGGVADGVARRASAPTLVVRADEHPAAAPTVTRIVVPLDGSALAEEALPHAARLGAVLGVGLHLVRVAEAHLVWDTMAASALVTAAYEDALTAARREATAYLADRIRAVGGLGLPVSSEVRTGGPAAELLAALEPGDLVAMTSHGRGGVRRWLAGSVAEILVREAAAPVLLVRAGVAPASATAPREEQSATVAD